MGPQDSMTNARAAERFGTVVIEGLGGTLLRVGRLPWNSNGRVGASSQGAYSR